MTSTSCEATARDVLEHCIAGEVPDSLPRELTGERCGSALFGVLVEGLSDRFDPVLCDAYARLFSPLFGADPARYQRVRQVWQVTLDPRRVAVLSRVTLGADVAITSVFLAAAKQRFPKAEILFVGPQKNYELFAGDPRIRHAPVEYRRTGLNDRLEVLHDLRSLAAGADTLVIDPDSRLTQLGLLPICPEDRYCFFDSRAYGSETAHSLSELASDWAEETFGVIGARPNIAFTEAPQPLDCIAMSLGVGRNAAKRVPDPFEEDLLRMFAQTGLELYIDKGAGGEEADCVARAVERSGVRARFWEGSFAGFARIIAGSRLYVGYDSAGQHVAAACGVPLITIFAGFATERMFERWRPTGSRASVIRVDVPDPDQVLERVRAVLKSAF